MTSHLGDYAAVTGSQVSPKQMGDEAVKIYSFPAYDDYRQPEVSLPSEIASGKTKINEPCVLVAKLNPRIPRIWRINELDERTYCSPEFLQLQPKGNSLDLGFLYYFMWNHTDDLSQLAAGTTGSHQRVQRSDVLKIEMTPPSLTDQRRIGKLLGSLDNKIESNRRARTLLRNLGSALFDKSIAQRSLSGKLQDFTLSISRGVTPKYADHEKSAPFVINQRCVRDGWASLASARKMKPRNVTKEKLVESGDIVVNSTGVGTLGRVAHWCLGPVFADSHVSIVKPNPDKIPPILLAYAMFGQEESIEALATGSTGQTELSPTKLGSLQITVPTASLGELAKTLTSLEERAQQLANEIAELEELRDALLPELMSGRIPVTGLLEEISA